MTEHNKADSKTDHRTASSDELVAAAIFRTEVCQRLSHIETNISNLTQSVNSIISEQDDFTKQLFDGVMQFKELENADKAIIVRVAAVEEAHKASAATKHNIAMMLVDKLIGTVLPWAAIATLFFGKGQ